MLNFTKKIAFIFFVLCFGSTALAPNNPHVIETDTGWVWFGYKKDYIHRFVEVQPLFPRTETLDHIGALHRFIRSNMRYRGGCSPPLRSTVFVTFVVETDGSLTNIEILRGLDDDELDSEAIRLIEIMPNWIPGKIRGRAVRTQFNMPIRFTLAG